MANLYWIAQRNTLKFLVFVLVSQAGSLNGLYVAVHSKCSQAEAEGFCQARGGYLCSFSSEADFVEIGNVMTSSNKKYWTGLKHNDTSNSLEFSDGTDTAFANGEVSININNGKLCVVFQGSPPVLKPWNCSNTEYYICKVSSSYMSTAPTQIKSTGQCYTAVQLAISQNSAEMECQQMGGNLCSFTNDKEIQAIIGTMPDINWFYWTGLKCTKLRNLSCHFSNGRPLAHAMEIISNFDNNSGNCIAIRGVNGGELSQKHCTEGRRFICEIPRAPSATAQSNQVSSTNVASTPSSSDNIQLTSTPSSSDIDQLSTFSSSDNIQLISTPSSSDIDPLSTFSSSDNIQLNSTPSSADIDQLSTLSTLANIQLISTPSSSDNQLKSTPSLSDINQARSTPLSSVSRPTKVFPTESKTNKGTHQSMAKVEPYNVQMDSVDVNNENSLSKLINITEKHIDELAQDNATNQRGSLYEISYVFEQRLTDYARLHVHAKSVRKETSDFVLVMRRVLSSSKKDEDIIFPRNEEKTESSKYTTLEDFIVIPKELFSNESIFVGVLYYDLDYVLTKNSRSGFKDEQLNTKIISAGIDPKPSRILKKNITFTLKHRNNSGLGSSCVFIQRSADTKGINTNFSNTGCSVLFTNDSQTTCTCNHMTSFAVLTRVKVSEDAKHISKAHSKALSVITYVGIALSLIGEGLTVASFVFLIGLKTEQAHLHTNLALSLGLAQIFFLISFHSTSYKPCCILVTALVHYFYLVTFNWMLCEGFHLYLMVVKVFNEETYLKKYYLFSWTTPLVVVVMSIVVAASMPGGVDRYISEDICWVSAENHFIWAFLGPVLLVCLANLVLLFLIVKEMTKMNKTKDGPSLQLRKSVKACLLLFPILGTTWVFCVLTIVRSSLVLEYIFTIFNSLQGFLIFLFHVVRSSEIRAVFQRKRLRWGTSFDMSNNMSTFQKTQTTRSTPPASAKSVKPIVGKWAETDESGSPDLFSPTGRTSRNQVLPAVEGKI